jgi:hypothetical protein
VGSRGRAAGSAVLRVAGGTMEVLALAVACHEGPAGAIFAQAACPSAGSAPSLPTAAWTAAGPSACAVSTNASTT